MCGVCVGGRGVNSWYCMHMNCTDYKPVTIIIIHVRKVWSVHVKEVM